MTKLKNRSLLIGIITILILGFLGLFGWRYYQNTWQSSAHVQATGAGMLKASQRHAKSNKLSYEIYYRPSCKDCQSIKHHRIPAYFNQHAKGKVNLSVMKVAKKISYKTLTNRQTNNWLIENYVSSIPTVIVKYHGYPIYSYSGTNVKTWQQIARQINPDTGKHFVKRVPKSETVRSDFEHSTMHYVPYAVDNLSDNVTAAHHD